MPPGGCTRRGRAVGRPLAADEVVLSAETIVPVVEEDSVVVGAKTREVGMLMLVAVFVAVGKIDAGGADVVSSTVALGVVLGTSELVGEGMTTTGSLVDVVEFVDASGALVGSVVRFVVGMAGMEVMFTVGLLIGTVYDTPVVSGIETLMLVRLLVAVAVSEPVGSGRGTTVRPSDPVSVVDGKESVAVPVAVTFAGSEVAIASEEAASDNMLENSEAREFDASGLVAITLLRSEYNDEASDSNAGEAVTGGKPRMPVLLPAEVPLGALVIVGGAVVCGSAGGSRPSRRPVSFEVAVDVLVGAVPGALSGGRMPSSRPGRSSADAVDVLEAVGAVPAALSGGRMPSSRPGRSSALVVDVLDALGTEPEAAVSGPRIPPRPRLSSGGLSSEEGVAEGTVLVKVVERPT